MKSVLLFAAAATALTFAAEAADAQTRTRARAGAAAQAPLPPAPYRLVGPGSEAAGTTTEAPPAQAAPAAAGAADEDDTDTGATPAQRATPAAPNQGGAATPATPATPAEAGQDDADEDDADGGDAGPDTPERTRAQTALRQVLGGLAAGTPDYGSMNEETAGRVRTQQPSLTPALKQYGAIQTITPLAATDGNQRFRVQFANGAATFVINTDAAGKITALGVES